MKSILGMTYVYIFSVAALQAEPESVNVKFRNQQPGESTLLDANFEGIVALNNCSGSIVRFETSEDTDMAMVMTNGHCVKFFAEGEVMTNQNSTRSFRVLSPSSATLGNVRATKVVYGTMNKTDLALYELEKNYQDIKKEFDVEPLTLSSQAPRVGEEIEVISGYWRRGYACAVEEIVHQLKEDRWTFSDSIRYSRPGCEIIGGTSGSPVILKGTRTAVAVNNTMNESGERCTMNNPCEVNKNNEVSFTKGYGYAQQIHWVYSCLNAERKVDLSVEGCELPKPAPAPIAKRKWWQIFRR